MLRFTLRQLEYFVAVGELGSIALAAQRVNVSSPSISTAIHQLEQEFGLPLFVRKHAHGLALTQAGRQMLGQARQVLEGAAGLVDLAGDISGSVRGPLGVGCLLTFAQVMVPGLRAGFERAHPDVRIRQFELNQAEIFSHLRRADIDVALTYDLDLPRDLAFRPIVTLAPYAILAPDHPLAERDSLQAEDLAPHPMVLLDLPLSADYFLSFFSRIGIKPNITERTRDMDVMRSLVANGFGYSIANVRPLNDLAPDGRKLRFVPLAGDVQPLQLGLLMTPDAENANVIRAFVAPCMDAHARGRLAGLDAAGAQDSEPGHGTPP